MATPEPGPRCHHCRGRLRVDGRVGRGENCPSCGADVRVCRNCAFYAPGAYNDCRESGAERVVDKERANFCDFFDLGAGLAVATESAGRRDALDALFRKR